MKKLLGWTLALMFMLAVFVVIVAATLPAATAYRYAEPRLQPLRLQGVDGTLWSGSATQASVFALPLGRVQWTLDPWSALGLRARGEAKLEGELIRLRADIDASRDQVLIERGEAQMPAAVLAPALDIPSLVLLGRLDLAFSSLRLQDGVLQSADGLLTWREAGVSGSAEARFSDITVRFGTVGPGVIEGRVADGGGALAADGTIRIEGGRFTAEVRLAVRGDDPQLAEALTYVGQRMPDGSSMLRVEGTLQRLF